MVYYAVSFAIIIQRQINETITTNREVRKVLEIIMFFFVTAFAWKNRSKTALLYSEQVSSTPQK
jgi:hypothetical protein